jgi:Ca2+-transporting ATPase
MALLEPTNLLLLVCALVYGLIGEPAEAAILLLFVFAISLLDLVQQRRSRRALAELARLSAPRAHVRRGGLALELAPAELLPGDLLRLEEGDRLAADASLREGVGLWLDESLLTGESLPQARDQPGERLLAGSLVVGGRGWAEVVAVAEATELGKIGRSLATLTPPLTRLQRHSRRLTSRLTLLALLLCAVLAVLRGASSGDWPEALLAALALALAVLPNEIPVVLALFLALGALRLARIGVLARWPAAVESLGSATVLAVDKTGTLTENRMALRQLLSWPEASPWRTGEPLAEPLHRLLELAVLASRHDPVDAMEQAIQRLAAEQLPADDHLHPDWPLEREYPLSRDLLVFSQLWRDGGGGWRLAAKGAPEAIAALCHLEPGASAAFLRAADDLARSGLRVLAVASGLEGAPIHPELAPLAGGELPALVHDFLFEPIGLLGLADPLRPEVPAAIAEAYQAGLQVVMITGDGPVTARSIADQAGLPPGPVLCGADLEGLAPPALAARVRQVSVVARVMPAQKLLLVQALQAAGEVVAMTGDGVNDAPALKAADIGVAMGRRGTAVARESADLVLLRDSFADLVAAIALGRRVEANLQRALAYTLAIHLPIAVLGLLPLLLPGQGLILLPVHIALLHLVIDPACTVVYEALPAPAGLMRQPPRPPGAPLFGPASWRQALGQGAALLLAVLWPVLWPGLEGDLRRSLVFGLLLLAGGGLVALNGGCGSRIPLAGLAIGAGLWLLLLASPVLQRLLSLAVLQPPQIGAVLVTAALAVLLAGLLGPPGQPSSGTPAGLLRPGPGCPPG